MRTQGWLDMNSYSYSPYHHNPWFITSIEACVSTRQALAMLSSSAGTEEESGWRKNGCSWASISYSLSTQPVKSLWLHQSLRRHWPWVRYKKQIYVVQTNSFGALEFFISEQFYCHSILWSLCQLLVFRLNIKPILLFQEMKSWSIDPFKEDTVGLLDVINIDLWKLVKGNARKHYNKTSLV